MKKYIIIFSLALCIILLVVSMYIFEITLTKKNIWSKINSVDGIIIGCMTKNGNKNITEKDKYDFVIEYILNSKYINCSTCNVDICNEEKNIDLYNEEICLGRESKEYIKHVAANYFSYFDYPLDETINISCTPYEYIYYDSKKIIYWNNNIVIIEYKRNNCDLDNCFVIKYIFDNNEKIKDVQICDSTVY